jgi:hypothetical protein
MLWASFHTGWQHGPNSAGSRVLRAAFGLVWRFSCFIFICFAVLGLELRAFNTMVTGTRPVALEDYDILHLRSPMQETVTPEPNGMGV